MCPIKYSLIFLHLAFTLFFYSDLLVNNLRNNQFEFYKLGNLALILDLILSNASYYPSNCAHKISQITAAKNTPLMNNKNI